MPRSRRPKLWRRARILLRRGLHRLERRPPAWLDNLTPWGGSVVAHAVLIILIAILAFFKPAKEEGIGDGGFEAGFADQLADDLTTLAPLDRAGDPFTTLDDPSPSLPADPTEVDPDVINIPDVSDRFSSVLERSPLGLSIDPPDRFLPGLSDAATRLGGQGKLAPFSGRGEAIRAAMLRREGGTKESEEAVELGLDWLARHQGPAGNWSLDPRPNCTGGGCPASGAMMSDTAATGIALLPMLGAGHSHLEKGRYQASIDRGLRWLRGVQKPSGELFIGGNNNSRMYSHAIAAMALCEAYGVSRDPELREPAERALTFIIRAQNPQDGGWRYQPGDPGDTSVFGWQMLALRCGALAGIPIPKNVVVACRSYLDAAAADPGRATYAYRPGRSATPVMTAEALLCRQYLGWGRNNSALRTGAGQVYRDLMTSGERNMYYWYYATQLLHNLGGKPWQQWNQRIREGLIANQIKGKGCDRGSWDPNSPQPDRWGRDAGRHYMTCLSLLTLEVYYRYLPLYQQRDIDPLAPSPADLAD